MHTEIVVAHEICTRRDPHFQNSGSPYDASTGGWASSRDTPYTYQSIEGTQNRRSVKRHHAAVPFLSARGAL
jgi:hypothetical protein